MSVNTIAQQSMAANQLLTISDIGSRYQYQPLSAGNMAPSFTINTEHGLLSSCVGTSVTKETIISLQDFIDYGQPLVILFFGVASRASLHIKKLEILHRNIYRQGGKLLVLTPIEPKHIKRELRDSHSLSIFHDKDNSIAEAFGLYDEENPLWQWVSGIEKEEETLPAFYVIAPDGLVAYQYVDFDFILYRNSNYQTLHFISELLEEVKKVSQQYHLQKAYQMVS